MTPETMLKLYTAQGVDLRLFSRHYQVSIDYASYNADVTEQEQLLSGEHRVSMYEFALACIGMPRDWWEVLCYTADPDGEARHWVSASLLYAAIDMFPAESGECLHLAATRELAMLVWTGRTQQARDHLFRVSDPTRFSRIFWLLPQWYSNGLCHIRKRLPAKVAPQEATAG